MAKTNPVSQVVEQQENKQVRRDLIFVVSLNLVFFAILFALFFWNQATGGLDQFFGNLLKF